MKLAFFILLLFFNFALIFHSEAIVKKKIAKKNKIFFRKQQKNNKINLKNKIKKNQTLTKRPTPLKPIQRQAVAKTPAISTEEPKIITATQDNRAVQVSVSKIPNSIRKMASGFDKDNPRNNAPIDVSEQAKIDEDSDRFNFDLKQFSEDEQDVLKLIEDADTENIEANKNIIFNNKKICLFMFIKANELRGTLFNRRGIKMLEILSENHTNDFVLLTALGASYYENKEFFKAKETLENTLKKLNRYSHKNVVMQIERLLSRIEGSILRIRGGATAGFGYDDNPLYLSSSRMISIFNLNIENPSIQSDFLTNISFVANYNFYFNDHFGSLGYFSTNFNVYNNTASRNMLTLAIGDGISFKYGKFKIDILGNYNRLWFGGNSIVQNNYFLQNYGASTNISYIFNKYFKSSFFFNYYRKDFAIIPEKNSNLYTFGAGLSFSPLFYTFIGLNVGMNYETASLTAYSNNTVFASIMINQILNRYFSVTANLFYSFATYKDIDPIVWVLRKEHSLIFQASLNYHFAKNFVVSLVYNRTQNFSNATLFTYNRNYYYVTFGVRF